MPGRAPEPHRAGHSQTRKVDTCRTCAGIGLRRQILAFLQHQFGNSGTWYYGIARGEGHLPVNPDRRESPTVRTNFAGELIGHLSGFANNSGKHGSIRLLSI